MQLHTYKYVKKLQFLQKPLNNVWRLFGRCKYWIFKHKSRVGNKFLPFYPKIGEKLLQSIKDLYENLLSFQSTKKPYTTTLHQTLRLDSEKQLQILKVLTAAWHRKAVFAVFY